jgi:hypothetical protein
MIRHIVIFKLTPPCTPEEKADSVRRLKEIFSPLASRLNYITDYKTGINILEADHAGDFVIDSTFASADDLNRYLVSDAHLEAVSEASAIKKTKIVVDYLL